MIGVGEHLDAARRRRVVALASAVIGGGGRGDRLARERVAALAPGDQVTPELAAYVERLLAIAVDRCAVCLGPGPGLHPACTAQHEVELDRAISAGSSAVRAIHAGGRRRR